MLFVDNGPNKDPRINLAIEEYLIKSVAPKEEILFFTSINLPLSSGVTRTRSRKSTWITSRRMTSSSFDGFQAVARSTTTWATSISPLSPQIHQEIFTIFANSLNL